MRYLALIISSIVIASCTSTNEVKESSFENELTQFRKTRNKKMAGNGSPIPKSERQNFVGLSFYPANESFQFKAKFDLIFTQDIVEMKTNTDRIPKFIPFGKIKFDYLNENFELTAYKSLDNPSNELFIPFTDLSNGKDSYATGRYLDVEIPPNDSILLDFNRCYNPYCAYSSNYSCPIPPAENRLALNIKAGEKKWH